MGNRDVPKWMRTAGGISVVLGIMSFGLGVGVVYALGPTPRNLALLVLGAAAIAYGSPRLAYHWAGWLGAGLVSLLVLLGGFTQEAVKACTALEPKCDQGPMTSAVVALGALPIAAGMALVTALGLAFPQARLRHLWRRGHVPRPTSEDRPGSRRPSGRQ